MLWILWAEKTLVNTFCERTSCEIFNVFLMRDLLINKKVENKSVNPLLAWSCQKYGLEMALSLVFHHYPRVKKETTVKWY